MARTTKAVVELFKPRSWNSKVRAVVARLVPSEVRQCLKQMPGDDMYADTMDYLQGAYAKAGHCYDESTAEALTEEVLKQFAILRGFHGCRPLSLASYRKEGLLTLTRQRLAQYAYAIFDGALPLAELQQRAQTANLTTRLGNIYFCADQDFLVSKCGHYLIYGPESLCCLWKNPQDARLFYECQDRARTKGIPTVFICDVPIDLIAQESRREIGRALLTWHFQLASDKPVDAAHRSRNWGYAITSDLPVYYIKGHFHPEFIPDPLRCRVKYRNSITTCEWCRSGPPRENSSKPSSPNS